MHILPILTFALIAMLASTASAQTANSESVTVTGIAPQKLICVRNEADTGSHFGASKVCHTENEWTMIHNQSQRTLERYDTVQNKTTRTPPEGAN
jgi:hypothetical protein